MSGLKLSQGIGFSWLILRNSGHKYNISMHETVPCLGASTVIHNLGGLNLNHYKHRGKLNCDPTTEVTVNLQLPSRLDLKDHLQL